MATQGVRYDIEVFNPLGATDEFLAAFDIALVNLICALGLPGSEELDIEACLAKIDEWAEKVRQETADTYDQFTNNPRRFDYSLGKFCMTALCTVLQRDCGVAYSPERIKDPGDARNSRDRFIHGITHGAGGTCASLPILYAAVGRRLGYPLRIVHGARHCFLRWDETDSKTSLVKDRFNIEATAQGFVSYPDSYYLAWPFPHPDPEIDPKHYLKSLTPREELADFLCIRSIVLMDNGKFVQAIQPAAWSRQLFPDEYSIQAHLEFAMLMALGILDDKKPPWIDDHPVVRPDGVTWSRYWWPRKVEKPELLPAAKLPPHLLSRILPPGSATAPLGDLADALYARANDYADESRMLQFQQVALAEEHMAEVLQINAMNRARREAMLAELMPPQPTPFSQFPTSQQQSGHQPRFPTQHAAMQPLQPLGHVPQLDWPSSPQFPLRPLLRPAGFLSHSVANRPAPAITHPR